MINFLIDEETPTYIKQCARLSIKEIKVVHITILSGTGFEHKTIIRN